MPSCSWDVVSEEVSNRSEGVRGEAEAHQRPQGDVHTAAVPPVVLGEASAGPTEGVDAVDTNHNGVVDRAEWAALGLGGGSKGEAAWAEATSLGGTARNEGEGMRGLAPEVLAAPEV